MSCLSKVLMPVISKLNDFNDSCFKSSSALILFPTTLSCLKSKISSKFRTANSFFSGPSNADLTFIFVYSRWFLDTSNVLLDDSFDKYAIMSNFGAAFCGRIGPIGTSTRLLRFLSCGSDIIIKSSLSKSSFSLCYSSKVSARSLFLRYLSCSFERVIFTCSDAASTYRVIIFFLKNWSELLSPSFSLASSSPARTESMNLKRILILASLASLGVKPNLWHS